MKTLQPRTIIILPAMLILAYSCSDSTNKARENNTTQTASILAGKNDSAVATNDGGNGDSDNHDTSSSQQRNNNADSMLSQMKNLTSMFGKSDSGMLKNVGGGGNMDSMMKKMQVMMGGESNYPGEGIANSILNLQLGQMSDNNPLKSVARGMTEAKKKGSAGPSKTYTAAYTPEQPAGYSIPVSGNGNTIVFQYTGGSISNGKKDGLWKNLYISTNKANKWNVYSEGYTESTAMNMNVHSTSLAGINENYSLILNDQYKKYNKQQRSDVGKNEFGVQVKKIGEEEMFGYNCVHVQITYTLKALGQTTHEQDDEWYSTDAPGSQFISPVIFENHSPTVVKKIMDADCNGILVKSVAISDGTSQLVQLTSITKKDMPDSIFNLPANYQEDKNTALYDIQ